MKKKVAVFIPPLTGRGGMETAIVNLYKAVQNDNEYDFTLVITGEIQDKKFLNNFNKEKIIYRPMKNLFLGILSLNNIMCKGRFDILIATSKRLVMILTYLRKIMFTKPIIVSWLHFSLSKDGGIYVNLLKYGDAHFAISKGMILQMKEIGVDEKNIYYLPNCVNTPEHFVKESHNIKFIYIGRIEFSKQKNIKELIDGLSTLKLNWSIDIYGDGEDKLKCEQYLKDSYPDLGNRVNWKGWVKDPWRYITDGTALLLSSRFEGMPMVLIEAISRGLPVFSSNCPTGPADIVNKGENGYLYEAGNLKDFTRKLTLLVNTKFNREKIIDSSKIYDIKNYGKRLNEYLNNLINSNGE